MNYDYVIIGNGILGITLAWKLSEANKDSQICLIGQSSRHGSASVASGAMLNVFGEIEEGFFEYAPLRKRFELGFEALKMWPDHIKEIEIKSKKKIEKRWGTHILNSAAGTKFEDSLFDYLLNLMQKKNFNKYFSGIINPESIEGLNSQASFRTIRSLKIGDGILDSSQLISAIDAIVSKRENISILDTNAEKLRINKNDFTVYVKNENIIAKQVILANGSFAQLLIDKVPEIKKYTPRLFFGAGTGILLDRNEIRNKFSNIFHPTPKIAMRTMDRGHACGLHWLPFKSHTYLGASSAVYTTPEPYPRSSTISFLLGDGLKQLSPNIGRSNLKGITYGYRPVSEDIFPLIGPSHIKGLWFLNGMKRDGLTCSAYIVPELVRMILGKKSKLPKIFYPSRNLISYYDKKKAIEKAIISRYNKENTHGMMLPDSNNFEKYYEDIKKEVSKIYDNHNLKKFGIHPELLSLYESNKINIRLIKK